MHSSRRQWLIQYTGMILRNADAYKLMQTSSRPAIWGFYSSHITHSIIPNVLVLTLKDCKPNMMQLCRKKEIKTDLIYMNESRDIVTFL